MTGDMGLWFFFILYEISEFAGQVSFYLLFTISKQSSIASAL